MQDSLNGPNEAPDSELVAAVPAASALPAVSSAPEVSSDSAIPAQGRGRSRVGFTLAAVAVAAGAFGVASVASAASNTPTVTPSPAATSPAPIGALPDGGPALDGLGGPGGPDGPGAHGGHRMGGPGMGGPGMGGLLGGPGLGRPLHGEFVVQKGDGTYQTVDMQGGSVTAVSATSVTVKSTDGFSKSYVVTATTNVNAARDGIGSVKVGDEVNIAATVTGGTATAVGVMDETTLKASGLHWGGEDKAPTATPAPSASTS